MDCVYKIRNKETGLFSKGGYNATDSDYYWSKNGKIWKGSGPLRSHLSAVLERNGSIPSTWEVIEMETIEKSIKPACDWVTPNALMKHLRTAGRK